MTRQYDVLAIGVSAVDDLLYIPAYPSLNVKTAVSAKERHGGGPACTAIAAIGTMQGNAAYCARLGNDELSIFIERLLQQKHVDTSPIVRDLKSEPYHSVILVDAEGNRNVFYDASRLKPLFPADISDELIRQTEIVLLDYVAEPALIEVALKIRKLGTPILGDIEGCSESAVRLASLIDHLAVPSEFARWASGYSNLKDACAYLAQTKRITTVVTAGADGCYYTSGVNNPIIHLPAFHVAAFDTNGCGDTFHGALALALARKFSIDHALTFASAAAAIKASGHCGARRGWDALPSLDEIMIFLRSRSHSSQYKELLGKIASIPAAQL